MMVKKCPYCQVNMDMDCYLKDRNSVLNDFILIKKDNNYKKSEHVLQAAMCPKCGYIEFYTQLKK